MSNYNGRIAFAPIFEKCNISFAPQGYTSFAPKNKIFICAIWLNILPPEQIEECFVEDIFYLYYNVFTCIIGTNVIFYLWFK